MKIKFLMFIFLASIISIGLIGCQSTSKDESKSNSTVEKAIETGKLALADGDFVKAMSNFDLALVEDKENKEAKNWLRLAKKMNLLSNHLENKEIEKAEEILADIKADNLYQAIKSRIDGYESTLTALKSSIENIDNEIAAINQKLEEEAFDEVIEKGNNLKTEKNITENQLATINSIIEDATKKKEEKDKQVEAKKQEETSRQEQMKSFSYNTYTNTRFGFSVEYPTTFTQGPEPTNNDGREFYNEDSTIIASGSHINVLEDNETIETYYNRALENISNSIAYKRLGSDWYVISYKDGSNTVYEKAIIGEDIISRVVITYPSSKQGYYESMVTRISSTFKSGQSELSW
ncbi:hypothetical protein OH784_29935 [Ectobacillus funiculus]|uniref:hypothetical protein n=1 Tax=Ectobacillus funiculus TaxID=137993 RepID=UPI00397AD48E